MRGWFGMVLVGLSGCAGEVEPLAAHTAATCEVQPASWSGEAFGKLQVSDACAAAVASDFGIHDVDAAVQGAVALLAWDWGELDGATPLDGPLSEVALQTGDEAVGWLAYDWAAHRIRRVRAGEAGEGGEARWRPFDRTIIWEGDLPGPAAAGVLLHEARHGDGERHVSCADGDQACDADGHGAYGFEAALLAKGAARADGPVAQALWALFDQADARVLSGPGAGSGYVDPTLP